MQAYSNYIPFKILQYTICKAKCIINGKHFFIS